MQVTREMVERRLVELEEARLRIVGGINEIKLMLSVLDSGPLVDKLEAAIAKHSTEQGEKS